MSVATHRLSTFWSACAVVLTFASSASPAFGQITGTVTSSVTAAPVASVSVSFYSTGGTFVGSTSTDEQGAYASPPLQTGSYVVWAIPPVATGLAGQLYTNISCANYCSLTSGTPVVVTAPNATPNINFALAPGGTITGTVTSAATSAPVAGVEVTFQTNTGSYTALTVTNAQGLYVSPLLPTGSYFVRVRPSSAFGLVGQQYNNIYCPGGYCSLASGTPVAVTAPNAASNVNFALAQGATITGTVTNATTSAAVAGVSVNVYSSSGSLVGSMTTDAQGVYSSSGLATGSYFIRAIPPTASGLIAELHSNLFCSGDCPPFGGTLVPLTVPNTTTINFALDPGGTITGTVTNASTLAPVAGVVVSFYTTTQVFRGSVSTNAQGVYTSPLLPTGSYLVTAIPSTTSGLVGQLHNNVACPAGNCPLTSGTPVVLSAPNPTTTNFALAPGAPITATVTNATTLAPVAGASVTVYSSTGAFIRLGLTNAQGVYTSPTLSAGSYFVQALPPYGSALVGQLYNSIPCFNGNCSVTSGAPVVVTAPSATAINFALATGASITGTVTNAATTAPAVSAGVSVYSSTGSFAGSVSTDAQGVYAVIGLVTGSYFVVAYPPNGSGLLPQLYNNIACSAVGNCPVTSGTPVAVTAPTATPNINFELAPAATITGTVTNAATAAAVGSVVLSIYSSNGSFMSSTLTNAQGAYTFAALPTGSYFVRALPTSSSGLIGQLYNNIACPGGACSVTTGTPVGVTAPNATSNINFALVSLATITGTITNASTGAPVAGVSVQVYTSTGSSLMPVSTDGQGVYTVNGLATGSYFVLASPSLASGLLRQLYRNIACPAAGSCPVMTGTPVVATAPNATPNINFALVPGGTITGIVTTPSDAPVSGAAVLFYSSTGSVVTSASTNAQGVYTASALPTGSYFVLAAPPFGSVLIGMVYSNVLCPGGSCNVTSGTPVAVNAPNAVSNINIRLALALDADNDTFANAKVIGSLPFTWMNSTIGATTTSEDPAVTCGNQSTQKSVWYLFTPTLDGPVVVTTVGSSYDTILSIHTGAPGSFSPVGCNNDFNGLQSSLTIQGTAGQRLAILVTSYSASGGVLVLNVATPPGAFGKSGPATSSFDQPLSPTLSWGASADATSYEYCYDTSNNNVCNASWIWVGTATSAMLSGLTASTTYYWHVRALNAGGPLYADGSAAAFWTFTTGTAVPAFGQVDTPVQNAAGVQGAIGVTGWALDDTSVTSVHVFRNCLPFEPANCQTVLGHSVVYIGDAVFLDGARPDVAAAFPMYPNNTRAGWGYLMLTPMLPNVTAGQPYGGEGPLSLYAVATDTNGNKTLLGRSSDPASPSYATPTAITMANATIAKPFGAIDTPGQGETISGLFNNFGWALTPDTNIAAGDPGDIVIPTNGSTMTVFIDGLPTALVAYNQCRGNVGNPVPVGLYCNDDVANIFGNPTPQPVLTTRTSNPTLFRNLDTGSAAIGAYTFDTTTLSNGPHTIAWSVTDSAGRTEGIGSRFFIVSNAGAGAPLDVNRQATPAPMTVPASTLTTATVVSEGVFVRSGFDLAEAWKPLRANDDRRYSVRLTELGRLELWLGKPVDAGYMVVDGTLQPLPVGTSLTGSVFAWMPPAGYLGPYHLVFLRGGERIDVVVMVVEKGRRF